MRVLLDNCVNVRFARSLSGHEVFHARSMGWEGLADGRLLSVAEAAGFDVLVTVDKNIDRQQNLASRRICLITLDAGSITLQGLLPMEPRLAEALGRIEALGLRGESLTLRRPAQA